MAKEKVYPFEIIGAKKLYDEKRFLLADEMGMFKTAQAIYATSKLREDSRNFRALTICPNSVKENWATELAKRAYPKPEAIILESGTLKEDIKKAKNSHEVILSYNLLSNFKSNGVLHALEDLNFKVVRLDEAHNAKNPDSLCTTAVKTLTDEAEYVHMLSGTPIPNTVRDIYMLMHFLDPKKYPINLNEKDLAKQALSKFYMLFRDDPEQIKRLFHEKMLRRNANDYICAKIPKLVPANPLDPKDPHNMSVYLDGDNAAVYQEILKKDFPFWNKYWQLEKASIDPSLVNPELIENPGLRHRLSNINSCKYKTLDRLIEEEINKGGKVVVFTDLKEGVVEHLKGRYKKFEAVAIDGDISAVSGHGDESKREILRKRFQYDKDTKVLIATTTMHEGVDLTAATLGIGLSIPWTPAELYQRIKRSQRPSEMEKDYFRWINLIAKTHEQESLDQAQFELLQDKQRVTDFLLESPLSLNIEDLQVLNEPSKIPRIKNAVMSEGQMLLQNFVRYRSKGKEKISKFLEKYPKSAKKVAKIYPNWSLVQRTADFYKDIIRNIESKQGKLENKIDLACGPGMLGFALQEPTFAIDLDKQMLRQGQKIYSENHYTNASMDSIPIKSNCSDLVLCSLAFQMTNPTNIERENTLREANRVLKQKGYFLLTIPINYLKGKDRTNLYLVANKLGFKLQQEYPGGKKEKHPDFYLFKKINKPKKQNIESKHLTFFGDSKGHKRRK